MKKKIGVIGIVLDNPQETQSQLNELISQYRLIIKGRMGIPFDTQGVSIISLVVTGTMDEINSLTGKIGNINGVNVKTSISKKEV